MKVLTESQTSSASGPPLEAFAVVTMVAAVDVVFAVVNLSFSVFVVVKRDAVQSSRHSPLRRHAFDQRMFQEWR